MEWPSHQKYEMINQYSLHPQITESHLFIALIEPNMIYPSITSLWSSPTPPLITQPSFMVKTLLKWFPSITYFQLDGHFTGNGVENVVWHMILLAITRFQLNKISDHFAPSKPLNQHIYLLQIMQLRIVPMETCADYTGNGYI